ncbi:MAG: hypothetical protein JXB48_20775 [Candidatus Latescibacteria bacterium]|nr:hypothetical protein [Candidatus Latescibacterota bacterium]
MLSDNADLKTGRIALFVALAFHGVIALIFLFITFHDSTVENVFLDVQFIELPEEKPASEPQEIESQPSGELMVREPEPIKTTQPESESSQETTTDTNDTSSENGIVKSGRDDQVSSDTDNGHFRTGTILRIDKSQQPETMPPISEHDDTTEVVVGPLYSFDTTKNIPAPGENKPPRPGKTWTNDDEMGAMRRDVMEAPEGGNIANLILAVPVFIGKHIFGKGKDFLSKRKKNNTRNNITDLINDKSLRFMILMWRDDFINPDRLSQPDRIFISQSNNSDEPRLRHNLYLKTMKKKSLATGTKGSKQRLYGAAITRIEMLQLLNTVLTHSENEAEKMLINGYITLIENCYDIVNNRVYIPEYMVQRSESNE